METRTIIQILDERAEASTDEYLVITEAEFQALLDFEGLGPELKSGGPGLKKSREELEKDLRSGRDVYGKLNKKLKIKD